MKIWINNEIKSEIMTMTARKVKSENETKDIPDIRIVDKNRWELPISCTLHEQKLKRKPISMSLHWEYRVLCLSNKP